MKNTLEGMNSILDEADDQISNVKDKVVKNTLSESKMMMMMMMVIWDNIRCNISIIRVLEEE